MDYTLKIFFKKISTFGGLTGKKIQRLYHNILKESNVDQKYLRCTDIGDNNFEVMRSPIAWNKVYHESSDTVKAKTTGKYSGYIKY